MMTKKDNIEVPRKLGQILAQLRHIDDDSVRGQFLETEMDATENVLRINGNSQGLIHLARLVLEIADKGYVGAHQHFDQYGNMDRCDLPIVIAIKAVERDL